MLRTEGVTVVRRLPGRLWGPGRRVETLAEVALSVPPGGRVGCVGASGAGKTTLLRVAQRLLRPAAGEVYWGEEAVGRWGARALAGRRPEVQLVPQDPAQSLDPLWPIWREISAGPVLHGRVERAEARDWAARWVRRVGLSEDLLDRRPSELSGGQNQRVAIARAIALEPRLLLLDEPLSALDASARGGFIDLLLSLADARSLAWLLVSHDLRVVRALCDTVHVMDKGRVIESGTTSTILEAPEHPVTRRLIAAAGLESADVPVLTLLAALVPAVFGGAVLVEAVFQIHGLGTLVWQAAMAKDTAVTMAAVVYGAVLTLLGFLLADLSAAWLDPRLRSTRAKGAE